MRKRWRVTMPIATAELLSRFWPHSVAILLLLLRCSGSAASENDTQELWRYETEDDIRFLGAGDTGSVLVGTEKGLAALDLESGRVSWKREDVGKLHDESVAVLPSKSYLGVRTSTRTKLGLDRKKRLVLLDVSKGHTVWDSSDHDEFKVERYLELGDTGYILLYGEGEGGRFYGLGVSLRTGERVWRQDDLFRTYPRELSHRRDLIYELFSSAQIDSDVILYTSDDGPLRLRADTGEVLWRTETMRWTEPRSLICVVDDRVYVPTGKIIAALEARTGHLVWRSSGQVPDRIWMVFETDGGLLARGEKFLDLAGDRIIFANEKSFGTIDLETGLRTDLHELSFMEGLHRIQKLDERRYVLLSPEDIALLTTDGSLEYHRHYDAPDQGILRSIYRVVDSYFTDLDHEYEQSAYTPRYHFMFTDDATASRSGRSVVRIDKHVGAEKGRVWIDARQTTLVVDQDTQTLVVKNTNREILAVRFALDP